MTDLTYTLDQIGEWLASEHLTDREVPRWVIAVGALIVASSEFM